MSIIAPGTQRETTPEPGRGPDVVASRLAAARARRAQAGSPGVGTSGSDTPAAAPTAAPPPADGPAPLSSAQRRLWFLQQLDPTSAAYTIPVVWDLEGELDEERLRTAWHEVVARHETLRTRIGQEDGEPRLVVDPAPADHWLARATTDPVADVVAEVARPFDLAGEQPWRVTLLRLGPTHRRLVILLHHVAADGWSVRVVLDELVDAYRGTDREPLTWTFGDVARHQARVDPDGSSLRQR